MFIATNFLTNLINRLESSHPTSQYYIKRNVKNKGAHQLWSCGVDCVNNCIWPIFDVTYNETSLHKNVLMKIIPKWTVLIETYLSPYFWPQSLTTLNFYFKMRFVSFDRPLSLKNIQKDRSLSFEITVQFWPFGPSFWTFQTLEPLPSLSYRMRFDSWGLSHGKCSKSWTRKVARFK